jgi:hypothetical protein
VRSRRAVTATRNRHQVDVGSEDFRGVVRVCPQNLSPGLILRYLAYSPYSYVLKLLYACASIGPLKPEPPVHVCSQPAEFGGEAMPGSVRRQRKAELRSLRGRATDTLVQWVVRMTMRLSRLIAAEPWKRAPHLSARARKAQGWSVAFRNRFT